MRTAIARSWALLFGITLLMLGNGLQGSLLSLRATIEGFPTTVTGLLMSGYYMGFLVGSTATPRILQRVGHIRVFAALASVLSTAVLLHAVFVTPMSWAAMRLISGFCIAGLYVVSESWLNDCATAETRGQILSVYMVLLMGGMAAGQLLLNLADPRGFELFILISVLVSLALVPILLTVAPAPRFDAPAKLGLAELYRISPLGVFGCLATGLSNGAVAGMGAVYASALGLSVGGVSAFMGSVFLGAVVLQWPIGRLSDRFDRRRVITLTTLLAAAAAFALAVLPGLPAGAMLALAGLFGGLSFPLYALCVAHANDYLEPEQMVAASAGLVLAGGLGALAGPAAVSAVMSAIGPAGFFWCLAAVHLGIGVFAIWRMIQRAPLPLDEQGAFVIVTRAAPVATPLAVESAHEADETAEEAPAGEDAREA